MCAIGYEETSGNGGILVRDPHVLVRFLVVDHDVCKRYANKRVTRLVVFCHSNNLDVSCVRGVRIRARSRIPMKPTGGSLASSRRLGGLLMV